MNNRTAEFIMTIIGASLAVLGVFIMGIISFFTVLATVGEGVYGPTEEAIGAAFVIAFFIASFVLALIASVFGFIGAFKLKNGLHVKAWSITLIVIGGFCFFSYGFITGVLFLISGIMSLVKISNENRDFDAL